MSLRVSTTSKLLMFSSFLFRPDLLLPRPRPACCCASRCGRSAAWPGRSSSSTCDASSGSLDYRLTQAFQDAYQLRPHSFVVGGFALVIAVQLISLGLLATQTKRYFEETFHLGTSLIRRLERMERAGRAVDLPEVVPARLPEPASVGTGPAVGARRPRPSSDRSCRPPVVPVAPRLGLDVVGRHGTVTSGDIAGSRPG